MSLVPCLLCRPSCSGVVDSADGPSTSASDDVIDDGSQINTSDDNGDFNSDVQTNPKINGIKIEEGEVSEDLDQMFEQGDQLREHLIDAHARIVAKAFLYPDLSDSMHFWLMACVEYGTPPADPMISGDVSISATQDTNGDATVDDESTESRSDSDPGAIDIASVLSAFLNAEVLTELNGMENGDKPNRKRSAAIALDDSGMFGKKKSQWEENPNLEINDDFHCGGFDPLMLFENAEEIASASGLVDSKAKNKVTCVVCKIDVCNTARQRHVFMVHVKRDDMYQCPKCDYLNSNSVWEAKKHCTSQHGPGVEPISNEEKYKGLIITWNKRCFPDWKQKRPQSWAIDESRTSPSPSVDNDDVTAMIRDAILRREPGDSIIREEDRDSEPRTPAPDGPIDDRTCHLCWEESRYPGRHIAQKHLKKPLYECSVCEGFGSYEGCTVMKHIHKVHPDNPDAQPISNLEKYADEIRELQSRCFPNRPMKLVRPKESTRPRERHHCKKCGTQVAQSDRQRHVYHRHLQRTRIFECPLCNFASNYDVHRVKWHIKWMHKDDKDLEPISHENEFRKEIDQLNEECFPGWQHRRKPFWWLENDPDRKMDSKKMEMLALKAETDASIAEVDNRVDMILNQAKEGTPSSESSESRVKEEVDEESNDTDITSCNTAPHQRGSVGQPMKRHSEWTCRLCEREFKPTSNFLRHVAKDHLDMPLFQCPLCEDGAADAYEVKAHMVKVHNVANVDPISNLELNPEHVQERFQKCFPSRKMKPGTFDKKKESAMMNDETKVTCQECFQEMKTEDRQIHVYRHHLKEPRLYECPVCDFAHHACSSDVRAHIKFVHRDQPEVMPKANLLQYSTQIAEWNDRCFPGWINRKLPASVMEDFNRCRLCDEDVRQTSRHIAESHLMIQLHQCPLCEYGAPESRLVKRHLKNNHMEYDMEPIANVVARRADFSALHDKCFPGRPKRLSNITISDDGRRTKCKMCSATISRKRRLTHTLEKHMSMPSYGCSACQFTHNWDESAVTSHIKADHPRRVNAKVLCLLSQFEAEMRETGTQCFPDWVIESSQFE